MQTRRQFGKIVGTGALALGIGEISMGLACPVSTNVVNNILKYIPVAVTALTGILSVLSGNGIVLAPVAAAALAAAKVVLADLVADITQYENAPAADKTTLLGKISTALAIVEANLQQFWNDLNLPSGNVASIIEGVLTVVLSTLAAFATQLPTPVVTAALKEVRERKLTRTLTTPAKKRSLKEFKSDLNTAFGTSGVKVY
jgi:hypothetical protein